MLVGVAACRVCGASSISGISRRRKSAGQESARSGQRGQGFRSGRDGQDGLEASDGSGVHIVLAQTTDVGQHAIEGLAVDELHGVIADAVLLAVIEDADDVGVVQPRSRPASAWNRRRYFGSARNRGVHDLERHPALERLVLGLVDDAHPSAADPAEDRVSRPAARAARCRHRTPACRCGARAGGDALGGAAELLQLDQGRDQLADPSGQLGMACRSARSMPAAHRAGTGPETTRRPGPGDRHPAEPSTHCSRPGLLRPSGLSERISLSRPGPGGNVWSRPTRPAPEPVAHSPLVSCSKCRRTRTSRSVASMPSSTSSSRASARPGWPPRSPECRGPGAAPRARPSWPRETPRR